MKRNSDLMIKTHDFNQNIAEYWDARAGVPAVRSGAPRDGAERRLVGRSGASR